MSPSTDIGVQLIGHSTPAWEAECLASLARQPVTLTRGDAIHGNVTQARLVVFSRMQQEWLSWVDPDDTVMPGAYAALLEHARPGVGLVTGDVLSMRPDGRHTFPGPFHGQPVGRAEIEAHPRAAHKGIIHRSALPLAREIIGDQPYGIEWALMLAASLVGTVVKVERPIYRWRKHAAQLHRSIRFDRDAILSRYFLHASER